MTILVLALAFLMFTIGPMFLCKLANIDEEIGITFGLLGLIAWFLLMAIVLGK